MTSSTNRLVHDAVMSYDRLHCDGLLRYEVLLCFLPESRVTLEQLHALMPPIFLDVTFEVEEWNPNCWDGMTEDEVETAVHNGLQFTARVDRLRRTAALNRSRDPKSGEALSPPYWPCSTPPVVVQASEHNVALH